MKKHIDAIIDPFNFDSCGIGENNLNFKIIVKIESSNNSENLKFWYDQKIRIIAMALFHHFQSVRHTINVPCFFFNEYNFEISEQTAIKFKNFKNKNACRAEGRASCGGSKMLV